MLSKQENEIVHKLRSEGSKVIKIDSILSLNKEGQLTFIEVVGQGKRLSGKKIASLKLMQSLGLKIEIYIYTDTPSQAQNRVIEFNPKDLMFVLAKKRKSPIPEENLIDGTYFKKKKKRTSPNKELEAISERLKYSKQYKSSIPLESDEDILLGSVKLPPLPTNLITKEDFNQDNNKPSPSEMREEESS